MVYFFAGSAAQRWRRVVTLLRRRGAALEVPSAALEAYADRAAEFEMALIDEAQRAAIEARYPGVGSAVRCAGAVLGAALGGLGDAARH